MPSTLASDLRKLRAYDRAIGALEVVRLVAWFLLAVSLAGWLMWGW